MKSTKPLVAVDCDTLLYASTAACEERSIEVLHEPTGKTKEFKNRTEFKELMKSREKEKKLPLTIRSFTNSLLSLLKTLCRS